MAADNLAKNPIHLGLGATSIVLPEFTGTGEWYMNYGMQTESDGAEGRLVSMHEFSESWDVWEVHPHGTEIVLCTSGSVTLIQRIGGPDGDEVVTELSAGDYAINGPGDWHTADVSEPCTCIFITAGMDTENHPRT